jgi:hypothetical protein
VWSVQPIRAHNQPRDAGVSLAGDGLWMDGVPERARCGSEADQMRFPLPLSNPHGGLPPKAGELVTGRSQGCSQDMAGPLWHGVITASEDIHRRIAGFRPGMNGNMGFGQQGKTSHPLWIESVGDQLQQGGTSTMRRACDGGPEERLVVELGTVTVVKLENAMFANRFATGWSGGRGGGERGGGLAPSRVGMQAGQALIHQALKDNSYPP